MNVTDLNALDTRILSGVNLLWGDLTLMLVLMLFILKAIREDSYHWRNSMAVRGAVGMFVYCLGMGMVRAWSVPLLILTKHGYPTISLENAYPVSLVGTVIAMVGMFCMVRVFSPVSWSIWGWLVPLAVSVTSSVGVILFL